MVAVAAVSMVGFLGVRAFKDDSPGYPKQLQRSVAAARDVAGSRSIELASTDGRRSAEAVVLPDGTGYLVGDGLPALTRERTYQLWAVVGPSAISVGVLGPDPSIVPFKMDGNVSALAITEETAGGVVSSRQSPIAVGKLA
jgi:hypothetical protein